MEIRQADFTQIVNLESEIQQLATGFDFLEGPVWHPIYQSLIFSDILGNSIYSWRADVGVVQRNRHSYMANGNAYDHHGRLITCEHATSRLSRTNLDTGKYEVLASSYEGKALNSPNDVVVKRNGDIYFTDPPSGRSAAFGVPRMPELSINGVYRLKPESGQLTLLVDDFSRPNGLCFSQDESRLFINDTHKQHIRVFDVDGDGVLRNGRLFADLTGEKPGVADGMKVDSVGNVYSCGPGGIHVFNPAGVCLGVITTPEFAANLVFGDKDLRSLFITATTSLYRLRLEVPGHLTYKG